MSIRRGTLGCPHPQISHYGIPAVEGPGRYIQTRGMSRCRAASRPASDQWPLQPDRGQCACFVFAAFEEKLIFLSLSFTCFVVRQDSPPSERQQGLCSRRRAFPYSRHWIITLYWGSLYFFRREISGQSQITQCDPKRAPELGNWPMALASYSLLNSSRKSFLRYLNVLIWVLLHVIKSQKRRSVWDSVSVRAWGGSNVPSSYLRSPDSVLQNSRGHSTPNMLAAMKSNMFWAISVCIY